MEALSYISMWVLGSVAVSLVAGFYLGRNTSQTKEEAAAEKARKAGLDALVELLKAVEGLTNDVGTRNTEMQAVQSHVGDLQMSDELEMVRQVLLRHVTTVLDSNQKLQDDLVYARGRMEEQAVELDRTRREAHTDDLCVVANRKAFNEKLQLMVGGFKRGGQPFVLLLADMDHFKWINDTHGHQTGDNVLRQLGDQLKRWMREGDFVARYGGDEFAILMPHTNLEIGLRVADRLRSETTRTNFGLTTANEEGSVTLSIGVAAVRQGDSPETILARADQALYASKHGGRNQVHSQAPLPSEVPPPPAPAATDTPFTPLLTYESPSEVPVEIVEISG